MAVTGARDIDQVVMDLLNHAMLHFQDCPRYEHVDVSAIGIRAVRDIANPARVTLIWETKSRQAQEWDMPTARYARLREISVPNSGKEVEMYDLLETTFKEAMKIQ